LSGIEGRIAGDHVARLEGIVRAFVVQAMPAVAVMLAMTLQSVMVLPTFGDTIIMNVLHL